MGCNDANVISALFLFLFLRFCCLRLWKREVSLPSFPSCTREIGSCTTCEILRGHPQSYWRSLHFCFFVFFFFFGWDALCSSTPWASENKNKSARYKRRWKKTQVGETSNGFQVAHRGEVMESCRCEPAAAAAADRAWCTPAVSFDELIGILFCVALLLLLLFLLLLLCSIEGWCRTVWEEEEMESWKCKKRKPYVVYSKVNFLFWRWAETVFFLFAFEHFYICGCCWAPFYRLFFVIWGKSTVRLEHRQKKSHTWR